MCFWSLDCVISGSVALLRRGLTWSELCGQVAFMVVQSMNDVPSFVAEDLVEDGSVPRLNVDICLCL